MFEQDRIGILSVIDAISEVLGDTDPPCGESESELREDAPLVWACGVLSKIIQTEYGRRALLDAALDDTWLRLNGCVEMSPGRWAVPSLGGTLAKFRDGVYMYEAGSVSVATIRTRGGLQRLVAVCGRGGE